MPKHTEQNFMTPILARFLALPIRWYLIASAIVAATIRLIGITKADIWHDEGYTLMLIQHEPLDIIARTARDFHPPLYYLLSHWWCGLFGTSELTIRSLSLICSVGVVILIYFIAKRLLFSEATARLAVIFAAFGPFLVRYSQEARMYGLAALLVTSATLALLIALDNARQTSHKRQRFQWWIIYGLLMASALYTHYYTAFIVVVHIGYAWHRLGGFRQMITNKAWWVGNTIAAGAFAFWLPILATQLQRVTNGYWIPPVDGGTIPATLMQFSVFRNNFLPPSIAGLVLITLACYIAATISKSPKATRPPLLFIVGWLVVPLLLALVVSLKQPVYVDRYFTYSSVAFYLLLACLVNQARLKTRQKAILAIAIVAIFCFGIFNVYQQANHQMGTIGRYVSQHFQPSDEIVSAELYTYFDFTYYNHSGAQAHLLSTGRLSGYGESSLLYERQNQLVVPSLSSLNPARLQRVWLVGKTGPHDYYTTLVPQKWRLISVTEAGDSAVRLYEIDN